MPNNLGEISQLKDGLNGLYQFVESYKKIYKVTGKVNVACGQILQFYEEQKKILEDLEKNFDKLK